MSVPTAVADTGISGYERHHPTSRAPGWLAGGLPQFMADDPTDDFAFARFIGSLEDIFESVLRQIDSFEYLLDPRTVPPAMLPWLASWIGVDLPAWGLSDPAGRNLLRAAQRGLSRRGTIRWLTEFIEAATGGEVVVDDGLRVYRLGQSPAGRGPLVIRVTTASKMRQDRRDRLEERLEDLVPAGVPWQLETYPE